MESKTRNLLGTIAVVSAIGMIVITFINNGNIDSYILPFLVLWLSVIIFFNKAQKEKPKKKMSQKQQNIILSIVSVALISGVITFFTTLF